MHIKPSMASESLRSKIEYSLKLKTFLFEWYYERGIATQWNCNKSKRIIEATVT